MMNLWCCFHNWHQFCFFLLLLQEHVIHEWGDTTVEFHNILALQYIESIKRLLEEHQKTLRAGLYNLFTVVVVFWWCPGTVYEVLIFKCGFFHVQIVHSFHVVHTHSRSCTTWREPHLRKWLKGAKAIEFLGITKLFFFSYWVPWNH